MYNFLNLFSGDLGEKRETAAPQSNIKEVKEVNAASCSPPEEELTDGERMTAELRDIISQFMQKVRFKDITKLPGH